MLNLLVNPQGSRPRILMYVQDSWGFGHIQRTSRLARVLAEGGAHCLILCGHREAGSIVPENCEYLRLPSLNIPLSKGSQGRFWGRRSPFELEVERAIEFRRRLILEVLRGFAPDAIVVENRPLGMMEELDGVLQTSDAKKVFLTRGIMTGPEKVRSHYLTARQEQVLADGTFAKIVVALDPKVWDLADEYDLAPEIAARLEYVGYFIEPVEPNVIKKVRAERGVPFGGKWIVCSAGAGALGEPLIRECDRLAEKHPDLTIDIVHGPHSSLPWQPLLVSTAGQGRLRFHRDCACLPLLHAAADIVVCPGGYNSLTEAMVGGSLIIVVPVQPDDHDEQYLHARRLAPHYPIRIGRRPDQLTRLVDDALADESARVSISERATLKFDGLQTARAVIMGLYKQGV